MTSLVPPGAQDDRDVVAAIAAGDHRLALTLLMGRYGEAVYRFVFQLARDAGIAEEVRQQTFVEAYRDLARFEGRSSARTWLLGIARHRCLDALKLRERWHRRYKNDAPEPTADAAAELDRELDRERLARLIEDCLARLAPAAREAVVLRYHQELTYDEAAVLTGERVGTLQQRVARSLPVLRRCVDARLAAPARVVATEEPTEAVS